MIADYAYDLVNHVNTVAYRNGLTNRTDYDPLGRAMQVRVIDDTSDIVDYRYGYDAEGNVTHYEYNALGNQAAVIDANSVRTSYLYDDLNRLVGVIENDTGGDPSNDSNDSKVLTQYVYDVLGNHVLITDARNYSSTYTVYDKLNRPVIVRDGLGNETQTRYNALGHRTAVTDADGGVTYYGYDGLNRLGSIQYPEFIVQYAYDAVGNRTVITDSVGVTTNVYDNLYRLISVDDPITDTVEYGYDLAGNRTQLSYPDGSVVSYTYDADNRLIQVEDWDNGLTTYSYDEASYLVTTTLPNDVVSVNEYDDAGRLVNLTHTADDTILSSYSYALNGVDNRTRVTETVDGTTRVIDYVYDPLDRLVSADYSTGESFEYAYDAVGNRTVMSETTALDETTVTTYTYDTLNRLLVSKSPGRLAPYTWDDRGNLTSDGDFTYVYDTAGRMVQAEHITTALTLVYTYTADGLRVAESVDGDVTSFVWDWASGLPAVLSEGHNRYLVGHETLGQWDGASPGGDWAYYLPDALGSARQEIDEAGEVVDSREWTPFGVEAGTVQAGLGYTGEWQDPNLGMTYLRARWYAPQAGRFTQRDPWSGDIRRPQTSNGWNYADGNPINRVDSTGLYSISEIKGFFGAEFYNPGVLNYFREGQPLAGRWGWLEVLRQAEDGDRLIVFKTLNEWCKLKPDGSWEEGGSAGRWEPVGEFWITDIGDLIFVNWNLGGGDGVSHFQAALEGSYYSVQEINHCEYIGGQEVRCDPLITNWHTKVGDIHVKIEATRKYKGVICDPAEVDLKGLALDVLLAALPLFNRGSIDDVEDLMDLVSFAADVGYAVGTEDQISALETFIVEAGLVIAKLTAKYGAKALAPLVEVADIATDILSALENTGCKWLP